MNVTHRQMSVRIERRGLPGRNGSPGDSAAMERIMHGATAETEALGQRLLAIIQERQRQDPFRLGRSIDERVLRETVGETISAKGIGADAALDLWLDKLGPYNVACDHPSYLAFIPNTANEVSIYFDFLISAMGMYGASWIEGSGAVYAENQALRWIADLAGFPDTAGGTFVPGGTLANLSALHAAREHAKRTRHGDPPRRWKLAVSAEGHSSVVSSARVLDIDLILVPVDTAHRMTGAATREALAHADTDGLIGITAAAGSTNLGVIDDLAGIADVCAEYGVWFHVDGAYGAAALAAPSKRAAFTGIERADSLIVDPHKWLFAPYDSAALIYRDAERGRFAHSQSAAYLDVMHGNDEWNPADYAIQLSRRPRGLPFWFSLVVHGTDAHAAAIEQTLVMAREVADLIRADDRFELLNDPELTVLVFKRHGWTAADYDAWSKSLIEREIAFVVPSQVNGEAVARLVILNPRTTLDDIRRVLATMD
jgi:glutamate/tyrosine decarboxylase-like PLP-dependent enzyme